jgi:CheY-like chemotaxis protein
MVAASHQKPHKPARRARDSAPSPAVHSVLTARSFLLNHETIASNLGEAGIDVRTAQNWEELLVLSDDELYDAVLVDMDAVEQSTKHKELEVSGHRFVTLLAKQVAQRPTALVVMTSLDFAEVEDLARVGVQAFLTPDVTGRSCIESISAAVARLRM